MALGVGHTSLEEIKRRHPYDPNLCLYKAILLWLEGQTPRPSWKSLADVLQFKMLQAKLAKKIAEEHYSDEDRAEEERYLKGRCDSNLVRCEQWGGGGGGNGAWN